MIASLLLLLYHNISCQFNIKSNVFNTDFFFHRQFESVYQRTLNRMFCSLVFGILKQGNF